MINVALNPSQHLYIFYVFEQMFSLIELETVQKKTYGQKLVKLSRP